MDANQTKLLTFSLEKKAKNAGGDKYICEGQPEFNIYFPQSISRATPGGAPVAILKLQISSAT
jgi:hypothetical protein